MKTPWTTLILALAVGVPGCGSSDPEPGEDCPADGDCGSLTCFCASDPIPGTCSRECSADADCADFGDGYTCTDFGTEGVCAPVKICLRTGG